MNKSYLISTDKKETRDEGDGVSAGGWGGVNCHGDNDNAFDDNVYDVDDEPTWQ